GRRERRLLVHRMARQGDARRGVESHHGRRKPQADGRDAVQRPAHVLGRVREDRRHRPEPADRTGRGARQRLTQSPISAGDRTMTDVRDAPASSTEQSGGSAQGHLIWYELMTPDGDAAKAFYDQVVGWRIGEPVAEYQGYRMIGRSDGGFAGGVLQLTD